MFGILKLFGKDKEEKKKLEIGIDKQKQIPEKKKLVSFMKLNKVNIAVS